MKRHLQTVKELEQEAVMDGYRRVWKKYGVREWSKDPRMVLRRLRRMVDECGVDRAFVSDMALASFVGASLGAVLEETVKVLPKVVRTADLFRVGREEAKKIAQDRQSLWYYLCHPRIAWSAFSSSLVGAKIVGRFFPFDPKGFAENAAGRLMTELFQSKNNESLQLDWMVGPTPTVGDRVAPELKAVVWAINEQRMGRRVSDDCSYNRWIYVNLQRLHPSSERKRSIALFEASMDHPDAFCLASISVDAPLYQGLLPKFTTVDDHAKELLRQLHESIFHPTGMKGWYAFVVKKEDRQEWWKCVETVIELSKSLTAEVRVFHELCVLGLIRAWQGFCVRDERGKVVSTIACKECIDRGGAVNAEFVWALSDEKMAEQERVKHVMSVLWGRPLLARRRLIESSRTRGFEALVTLPQSRVKKFLHSVWEESSPELCNFPSGT
jgi:hypothetical protein